MRQTLVRGMGLITLLLVGTMNSSMALAAGAVTFQVNGTNFTPNTCAGAPGPVLSTCAGGPQAYGNITIEPTDLAISPYAFLQVTDGAADGLHIKNATIKSTINKPANCNSTGSNYTYCQNILISASFDSPPIANPSVGTTAEFWRQSNFKIPRNNTSGATGSYFRVHGWAAGQDIMLPQQKSITCLNPEAQCWGFAWNQGPLVFSDLQNARTLKAQFWFGLSNKATDVLKIMYVGVYNPGGQGEKPLSTGEDGNDPTFVKDCPKKECDRKCKKNEKCKKTC